MIKTDSMVLQTGLTLSRISNSKIQPLSTIKNPSLNQARTCHPPVDYPFDKNLQTASTWLVGLIFSYDRNRNGKSLSLVLESESGEWKMEDGKCKEKKMKVMIAIDGSECSHYALQWAIVNLQETMASSELFIFTAQTVTDFIYANVSTHGFPHPDLTKAILENKKKAASALLDQAKCICAEHGIVAQTVTDIGDPKEKICEAAEKINVQLLILGSHSRGAIKRAFLGSVSNHCVHNAKCSVLVVKQRV